MVRSGLCLLALMGVACSIPNPLFELYEGSMGSGTASTGEPMATGSVGPTSASVGSTSGPDTDAATDTVDPTVAMTSGPIGVCGDGIVDPGETCDDGNVIGGDKCPANCVSESCGDGMADVDVGEECDDGNQVDDDMCTNACRLPACGDGLIQGMEGCDDGNGDDSDECPGSCQLAVCGDGYTQKGHEVCDSGSDNGNYGLCNLDCSHVRECGDGITDKEEGCDDNNDVDGDGCTKCVPDSCGNGVVDKGEDCDDQNDVDADECTNKCKNPACGDGVVQPGEQCDDGDLDSTNACTEMCLDAKCGDGYVWAEKEMCDDGNVVNEDKCLASCIPSFCGDGFVQPGEDCDDGNNNPNDGCSPVCIKTMNEMFCGNEVVDPGEECDGSAAPYKDLGVEVCSDGCMLNSCFRVHNDKNNALEELVLMGNNWLTPCVSTPGSIVVVMLVNDNKQVVYAAKGTREKEWTTDNLTRGGGPVTKEYDVTTHTQIVKLQRLVPNDKTPEVMMLTGQLALPQNPDCLTTMADGYGLGIFADLNSGKAPRVLVMGAKGGKSGNPRQMHGWSASSEISFKGINSSMPVCDEGVAGFTGTFHLMIL